MQAEFERNLPFAQSVARLRRRPRRPEVGARHRDQALLPGERRPVQGRHPGRQLRRSPTPTATRSRWRAGQAQPRQRDAEVPDQRRRRPQRRRRRSGAAARRYDPAGVYYHQVRGVVDGTDPGDSVEVWFEGGGRAQRLVHLPGGLRDRQPGARWSRPRTTPAPRRCRRPGPHYLDYYLDALAANGIDGRRLRRRRRAAGWLRTRSACSATTTR